MLLERLADEKLLATLENGEWSFLLHLVRSQRLPRLFDLRFRRDKGGAQAVIYIGERAGFRLRPQADGVGFALHGPNPPVTGSSPEGRVEAALSALPDNGVIDRQVAYAFSDEAAKRDTLRLLKEPLAVALEAHIAAYPSRLPTPPTLGQELDALALAADGAVELIEVKDGRDTGAIGWTPAQVGLYARQFEHWIGHDAGAIPLLNAMLEQRIRLGLVTDRKLRVPLDVRAVVAIGEPLGNEPEARRRVTALQAWLAETGSGWPNFSVRSVASDGTQTDLGWV